MATILAPMQNFHGIPRRAWRAKRGTPCQAEAVAIFAWGENCYHDDRLGTQASVQLANTTNFMGNEAVPELEF